MNWHRYTLHARSVVHAAQEAAAVMQHPEVDVPHLLYGIACEPHCAALAVLYRCGVSLTRLKDLLARLLTRGPGASREMGLTEAAERALRFAQDAAGGGSIGTECLLLGVLSELGTEIGVTVEQAREVLHGAADE